MFQPYRAPAHSNRVLYLGRLALDKLRSQAELAGRSLRPGAARWGSRPPSVPIAEVMATPVVTVDVDDPLDAVAALFVNQAFSAAPVLDESGKPVGIVTKTDILSTLHLGDVGDWRITARPRPTRCAFEPDLPTTEFHSATAADLMTPLVLSLPCDAPVEKAAALMAYEGIHHIVVRGPDQALVGMVSSHDLVAWFARTAGYIVPDPRGTPVARGRDSPGPR